MDVCESAPPPRPCTPLAAQCSNLYQTGCFLIQHDLSPGSHPIHQDNHHDSRAMISGGAVGEERAQALLEAHLWWTRSPLTAAVLLETGADNGCSVSSLEAPCPRWASFFWHVGLFWEKTWAGEPDWTFNGIIFWDLLAIGGITSKSVGRSTESHTAVDLRRISF